MRTELFKVESCGHEWPIFANTETVYKVIQLYDTEVIKREIKAKIDLILQDIPIDNLNKTRLGYTIRQSMLNHLVGSNATICGKFVFQCRLYETKNGNLGFILEDYATFIAKNSNLLISYRDIKTLYQNPETVKKMVRKAMKGDYGLTEHKKCNVYEIFGPTVTADTNSMSCQKLVELYEFFKNVYAEFGYDKMVDEMVINHSIAGYAFCQMRLHTHGKFDLMIFIYDFIVNIVRLESSGDDLSCLSDLEELKKNHYQSRYIRKHKLLKRGN